MRRPRPDVGNAARRFTWWRTDGADIAGRQDAFLSGRASRVDGRRARRIEKNSGRRVRHFDAHADLREDYIGGKASQASVMRRVWDIRRRRIGNSHTQRRPREFAFADAQRT
jgi:hypothetical protein